MQRTVVLLQSLSVYDWQAFDMDKCCSLLGLIWITIMKAPKASVVRWHKGDRLSHSATHELAYLPAEKLP